MRIDKYYVSMQLFVPQINTLQKMIDKDDLFVGINYCMSGLETDNHTTIIYTEIGDYDIEPSVLIDDLYNEFGVKNTKINIPNVSLFEPSEYDVIILKVDSKQLTEYNKYLVMKYGFVETFSEYKPHITIGYVKKGMGKKYVDMFNNLDIKFDIVVKDIKARLTSMYVDGKTVINTHNR